MRRYRFQQNFPMLWVATLVITALGGTFLFLFIISLFQLINIDNILWVLFVLPLVYFSYYLTKFTSYANVLIEMDEVGIRKKYLKQPFFLRKTDIEVYWEDIISYKYEPSWQFDRFVIKTKNIGKIWIFHNKDSDSKDDFLKLIKDFKFTVNRLNFERFLNSNIGRMKVIYETNYGLFLAVICLSLLIAIPIMLFSFPVNNNTNYAGLAFSYIGGIYFIFQVYIHRKNYSDTNSKK